MTRTKVYIKTFKKRLLEKLALYLILLLAAFALESIFKSIFLWEKYVIVFFVTVLISTNEAVSIYENILEINPQLTLLKSLIALSKSSNKKAIEIAEKKIEQLEISVVQKLDDERAEKNTHDKTQ